VLGRFAYLNAGSTGPLPRRTAETIARYAQRDLEQGRSSSTYFEEMTNLREKLRGKLARLLGAAPESVALARGTTDGCNVVTAGLDLRAGDEVVTTDSEHPGLFGGLTASPATLRVAAVRDRPIADALGLIEAEITERTRLIALSHVSWLTGAVLPVQELAGHGIPLLVDGAQAAGTIPVDVEALGCDFYTVSAQKWLLGPDSTGCLFVRPERVDELRMVFPSYSSWQRGTYQPQPGAARFDAGWLAPGLLAALLEAIRFAEEVGDERFGAAAAVTARCRDLLAERVELVTEPGQATLVTWKADGDSEEAVRRFADAGVVVRDLSGLGWLRASCGFWTSDEDLERLVRGL
jgi:L-cysteine/cystine lyase